MRSYEQWKELEARFDGKGGKEIARELGSTLTVGYQIARRIKDRDYPPPGYCVRHKTNGTPPNYNAHSMKPSARYVEVLKRMQDKTLEEVGQHLGITRERVRQLYFEHKIPRRGPFTTAEKLRERFTRDQALIFCMGELTQEQALEMIGNHDKKVLRDFLASYGLEPFFKRHVTDLRWSLGLLKCTICKTTKPINQFTPAYRFRKAGCSHRCAECLSAHYERTKHLEFNIRLGNYFLASGPNNKSKKYVPRWTKNQLEARIILGCNKTNYNLSRLHPEANYVPAPPKIVSIPLTDESSLASVAS